MQDDRFFPANNRESEILRTLSGEKLEQYKRLRYDGKTVMQAIEATDAYLFATFCYFLRER